MAYASQKYAKGKQYKRGACRAKLACEITKHTADDEVDAFYENARVKRGNKRIRHDANLAKKMRPVSLAKMPWD